MARLEEARLHTQKVMQEQQKRLDERFARMQEKLERKAGKPSVSQQRIVEAALELLKEDGLANISLRKLAARLDMQAPALYWHFKNKEELVDYMAEAILTKEFPTVPMRADDESWQDWLICTMKRLRKAMLAYPDGARVVAGAHLYPAVTLARLQDTGMASLKSSGMGVQQAHYTMLVAINYTFGHVIEEQAAPTDEEIRDFDLEGFLADFPHMREALQVTDLHNLNRDVLFETALGFIIRGSAPVS